MAYDPEARETSNNAMIIGVVALVLVVLGALAYYATRQPDAAPVVVTQPATERVIEKTTEVPVTVPGSTTIVTPGAPAAPAPAPATRTIERNTTTVVTPGATAPAPAPRGDTNVTVNTPPAAKAAPSPAPAGDAADTTPAPKY